jgi:hypothetical protein
MILYAKFGEHQPLNRQSLSFAREGIELDVSTLADWVGACTASLSPLLELIRRHVLAAARLHGDDTTVPVLAKGKTITGRVWTYVRDDQPFAGPDPPAALFFYSRSRGGEHPNRHLVGYTGILQADAGACPRAGQGPDPWAGFGQLYEAKRSPRPITEAACWAHGRRKFFELADLRKAPLAVEAVCRMTRSLRPSAKSTARRPKSGAPSASNGSNRWSTTWKHGCAPNAPGCRAMPGSPKRWITCPSRRLWCR